MLEQYTRSETNLKPPERVPDIPATKSPGLLPLFTQSSKVTSTFGFLNQVDGACIGE